MKTRSALRYLPIFLLAIGFVFFLMNCGNTAQKSDSATAEVTSLSSVEEGKQWYNSYCAICHGENGDGKGSLAGNLDTAPPSMTYIAKRRDGVFPDDEVAKIIGGVESVPGHSVGEMPAWWETFQKSEGITDENVLKEKINHIVAYLKTIQLQ